MTLVEIEIVNDASSTADVPTGVTALRHALLAQRKYTLALYADLPPDYWEPRNFPARETINPPLWELAHIGWFQEFFALRWRPEDVNGQGSPSCLDGADQLFDSRSVAHQTRWQLAYPSKETCLDYMRRVLENVIDALEKSRREDRYGFQLALVHEDMHAEALAMTLTALGLPLPAVSPGREAIAADQLLAGEISCTGGAVQLGTDAGAAARAFSFDNEKPPCIAQLQPFAIDARVVTAAEFSAFATSSAFHDSRLWSVEGKAFREARQFDAGDRHPNFAAMHVSHFEAEAYCRWKNRRLPTEAEWECAATSSAAFLPSTGHVWEWTATPFAPYPQFEAGPYREYSAPWFLSNGVRHQVLKGGSFITNPRLKYPQYRNFYTPERSDMFCGFRTCAIR